MDDEAGEGLVMLARKAIYTYLTTGKLVSIPQSSGEILKENRGVFVTLKTYPGRELRGCIGIPEPIMPLAEATIDAAISSATRDPRFHKVRPEELSDLTIEVTVLTRPEPLIVENPHEYTERIELGRHGLTIEKGHYRGLLLPQVPVEHGFDTEEYLGCLCTKAGLPSDSWSKNDVKICSFEGIIFSETSPGGPVVRKTLS